MNKDKVVLISGSSSGIGLAIAKKYRQEGYTVCGIDITKLNNDFGMNEYECDISDEESVEHVFKDIESRYSKIHYLINCAGIFFAEQRTCIDDISAVEWNRVIMTNLTGAMLVTKYALPLLKLSAGDRAILNIASDQVIFPRKKNSAYAASKGGLVSFSKACAVELLEYGIRVNVIEPASVRSNFIQKLVKDTEHMKQIYEKENEKMPLGLIEAEDVAEFTFFLGSNKAKRITGQVIMMDSGLYI